MRNALLLALLLLTRAGAASPQEPVSAPNLETVLTSCKYSFTSGTGLNQIQVCIDDRGSLLEFISPAGENHLVGSAEGFGICDIDATTSYFYYAMGGQSSNLDKSVDSQPGGPGTFPVKVVTKTTDGAFTLTQTFSWNPNERIVKVAMALKNNTTVSKRVYLLRFANINADTTNTNQFGHDLDSAWGSTIGAYGLMLSTTPTPVLHNGIVQSIPSGPDPCIPFGASVNSFTGDGSVLEMFNDNNLGPGVTYTFNVEYKRF